MKANTTASHLETVYRDETGECATWRSRNGIRYTAQYVTWLEEKCAAIINPTTTKTEWVVQVRSSEWVGPNYKWSDYITRASQEEIEEAKTKKYLDVGNYKDLAEYMFTTTNQATLEFRTVRRVILEYVEALSYRLLRVQKVL